MACCLFGAKPLPAPMLTYCQPDLLENISIKIEVIYWMRCILTHWPLGNFRHVSFKQILVIDGWGISCEIALIWMSVDFTDDQSTLVQVMTWCRQATSHYLSQYWARFLSPHGITRPHWVKVLDVKGQPFCSCLTQGVKNNKFCMILVIIGSGNGLPPLRQRERKIKFIGIFEDRGPPVRQQAIT